MNPMNHKEMKCLRCDTSMPLARKKKQLRFREMDITFVCEEFVCPKCGMEAGRLDQAAVIQMSILEAYRKKLSRRARVNVKD